MNKDLIKKRFAKNLQTYNNNAEVQKHMAERLLSFASNKYENILEIGCGTGLLTQLAIQKLHFQTYTANDIVKECNEYIKVISPEINFICDDIEHFLEQNNKKYDLIISNAVFQWIENIEDFITKLQTHLTPNGHLLFSTFGVKNFQEMHQILGKSLPYQGANEYEKIFQNIPHKIEEETCVLEFNTPKEVLKHIKNTGVNAINETFWTKSDIQNFENKYNKLCPKTPTLTYNPIYISIK